VSVHRPGGLVVDSSRSCHALTLVVEGTVQACVTATAGRRITFKVGGPGGVYGVIPMLDGREMPSDLIAVASVVALAIPYSAVRAELIRTPALWESLASEMGVRARGYTDQMRRFLFDGPRVRMAALLASFAHGSAQSKDGSVALPLQLSQERLAEMLGISRQWATGLVREMCDSGLIGWRYGRVTVFDMDGLRAIARESINPHA
jgi:CRP/FNR family transcriptional regulator, cyclic AMP receptor protein